MNNNYETPYTTEFYRDLVIEIYYIEETDLFQAYVIQRDEYENETQISLDGKFSIVSNEVNELLEQTKKMVDKLLY